MIFRASWLTLGMFSAALAVGATPPQTPPAPDVVFVILRQIFSQFAKRIQELAEDKAENKLSADFHKNRQTAKFNYSKLFLK